jgi:hypothetical protein
VGLAGEVGAVILGTRPELEDAYSLKKEKNGD